MLKETQPFTLVYHCQQPTHLPMESYTESSTIISDCTIHRYLNQKSHHIDNPLTMFLVTSQKVRDYLKIFVIRYGLSPHKAISPKGIPRYSAVV